MHFKSDMTRCARVQVQLSCLLVRRLRVHAMNAERCIQVGLLLGRPSAHTQHVNIVRNIAMAQVCP